jgi:hypothetical protein
MSRLGCLVLAVLLWLFFPGCPPLAVCTRVAIFRQKNYSAEYETRRNRREFRRNSACFTEEKTSEFRSEPFLGRKKPLEFRSRPFLNDKTMEFLSKPFSEVKTSEFCSEPFSEERKLGIPFRTIFGRENT